MFTTNATDAAKAIFVVGSQRIVPDLETAMRRIQVYIYPKEDVRTREKYGRPSALAKVLIINLDWPPTRSTVVLIREPIGLRDRIHPRKHLVLLMTTAGFRS